MRPKSVTEAWALNKRNVRAGDGRGNACPVCGLHPCRDPDECDSARQSRKEELREEWCRDAENMEMQRREWEEGR